MSIITFSEELFYPVSVGTVGVFMKKGYPHNWDNQNIYFARTTTVRFRKKSTRRDSRRIKNLHTRPIYTSR